MDLESEFVELRLKVKELERENKKLSDVVMIHHKALNVLSKDFQLRTDPNLRSVGEGMYE